MKLYISGPITGVDTYKEKFAATEKSLRATGCKVINPAKVDDIICDDSTYDEIMEVDLLLLKMCDGIFLLNGWNKSKGAKIELRKALELEMPIFMESDGYHQKFE